MAESTPLAKLSQALLRNFGLCRILRFIMELVMELVMELKGWRWVVTILKEDATFQNFQFTILLVRTCKIANRLSPIFIATPKVAGLVRGCPQWHACVPLPPGKA